MHDTSISLGLERNPNKYIHLDYAPNAYGFVNDYRFATDERPENPVRGSCFKMELINKATEEKILAEAYVKHVETNGDLVHIQAKINSHAFNDDTNLRSDIYFRTSGLSDFDSVVIRRCF